HIGMPLRIKGRFDRFKRQIKCGGLDVCIQRLSTGKGDGRWENEASKSWNHHVISRSDSKSFQNRKQSDSAFPERKNILTERSFERPEIHFLTIEYTLSRG